MDEPKSPPYLPGFRFLPTDDAMDECNSPPYPPGFRFLPTDEELITFYLKPRLANLMLPCDVIKEVDLYKFSPQQLADIYGYDQLGKEAMYFFTPRDRKYQGGNRPNRRAGKGFWKATAADTVVRDSTGQKVVGYKKVLTYYNSEAPAARKTKWIMYEYRIKKGGAVPRSGKGAPANMKLDHWVICRVHKHLSKEEKEERRANIGPSEKWLLKHAKEELTPSTPYHIHTSQVPPEQMNLFPGPAEVEYRQFMSQHFPVETVNEPIIGSQPPNEVPFLSNDHFGAIPVDPHFNSLLDQPRFHSNGVDVGSSFHGLPPLPVSTVYNYSPESPNQMMADCWNSMEHFASNFMPTFSANDDIGWNGDLGLNGVFEDDYYVMPSLEDIFLAP